MSDNHVRPNSLESGGHASTQHVSIIFKIKNRKDNAPQYLQCGS